MIRMVGIDTARHSGEAKEVHREERQEEADIGQPEMHTSQTLVEQAPGHLREPVIDTREDCQYAAAKQDEVQVSHDEVRRVQVNIHRDGGQEYAADAA